jgi:hypothetical protein
MMPHHDSTLIGMSARGQRQIRKLAFTACVREESDSSLDLS